MRRIGGVHRQAVIYTAGSLLATAFVGLAKLLLARKLSVAEFAVFALTLSTLQYMSLLFSDFGLLEAMSRIIAQARRERRGRLVWASVVIYMPLAIFFSVAVFAVALFADSVFEVKIGSQLMALAPLAAVWPVTSYIGMMIARGRERLASAALANAFGQAVFLVFVLVIADSATTATVALLVLAATNWLAALLLLRFLGPQRSRSSHVAGAAFKAAKRWGFRTYVGRILGIGSYNMDVLMLAALSTDVAVANYTLATAVTAAAGLPAIATANSLYGKLAVARTIGRSRVLLVGALSTAALPLGLIASVVVVKFVLPDAYEPMIMLAIPLGLAQVLRGLGTLVNLFLASHGRGSELLFQGTALTAANLILNFALIPPFGAQGAAWASAGALLVNLVVYLHLYRKTLAIEAGSAGIRSEHDETDGGSVQLEIADNSSLTARISRIGPRPVLVGRMLIHRLRKERMKRATLSGPNLEVHSAQAPVQLTPMPIEFPSEIKLNGDTPGIDRIIAAADRALAHQTELLGAPLVALGSPIDWHRDAKSGYRWDPKVASSILQVTRLDDDSDAKMPWEVSRSHHMLALARAARANGDERYLAELELQLDDWISSNPVGCGINWVNAMEVSIRAINWIWALNTLPEGMQLSNECSKRVVRSLREHAWHISQNLEGSPLLRGNHYLADEVGLFVLGWALDGDDDASRWGERARAALEREIQLQIHDDGLNFEASTSYHGLAIELFLIPWIVAEWSGRPFSTAYRARLEDAVSASLAIRRPDGRIPLFGDNDSSRVLPLDEDRTATHDPLLWLAAGVLGTPAPSSSPPSPEVAWTAGVDAHVRASTAQPFNEEAEGHAFPEGGIWIMKGGPIWAAVRCGDVGQLGTGGHAHNDALSFECTMEGQPLIVDPGTLVYTADPAARNNFRSTSAHSTVSVDGLETNPIDPSAMFQLRQVSDPTVTTWSPEGDVGRWSGWHDGWLRIASQVVHARDIELDRSAQTLRVADSLTGGGRTSAVATYRLAPGLEAELDGDSIRVSGQLAARITPFGVQAGQISIERGLVAPMYGVSESAVCVRIRVEGRLPLEFGVVIERENGGSRNDQLEGP